MNGRLIVIEPGPQTQAALVVDGRLEDLFVDAPSGGEVPLSEEVHRVRVRRMIPRQGAAHVKLAGGTKGFLRDVKGLEEGDILIAQVTGYAEPGKPAPLTPRRLHRGRYAIVTPDAPGVNVARAIRDPDERARLTAIGEAAIGADGPGLIIRSAAAQYDDEAIADDIADLLAMEASVTLDGPPERLLEAPGAEVLAWREWGDPDEVIREAGAFDRLGIWDQIDRLRGARADLPSGGWMSIEPTRALVAVDVNTGSDLSNNAPAEANREAAAEIFRQLRLRGLGGVITLDFAPMRKVDRKAMETALGRAAKADPVQTTLAGWTPLGAFEMLRKRERRPLSEVLPDA